MKYIDDHILMKGLVGKAKRCQKFIEREEGVEYEVHARIPANLSKQFYSPEWLQGKDPSILEALHVHDLDVIDADGKPKRF